MSCGPAGGAGLTFWGRPGEPAAERLGPRWFQRRRVYQTWRRQKSPQEAPFSVIDVLVDWFWGPWRSRVWPLTCRASAVIGPADLDGSWLRSQKLQQPSWERRARRAAETRLCAQIQTRHDEDTEVTGDLEPEPEPATHRSITPPESPLRPLLGARESSSSKKTTQGAAERALQNTDNTQSHHQNHRTHVNTHTGSDRSSDQTFSDVLFTLTHVHIDELRTFDTETQTAGSTLITPDRHQGEELLSRRPDHRLDRPVRTLWPVMHEGVPTWGRSWSTRSPQLWRAESFLFLVVRTAGLRSGSDPETGVLDAAEEAGPCPGSPSSPAAALRHRPSAHQGSVHRCHCVTSLTADVLMEFCWSHCKSNWTGSHHLGRSDGRGLGVLQRLQGDGEVLVRDGPTAAAQVLLLPAGAAETQTQSLKPGSALNWAGSGALTALCYPEATEPSCTVDQGRPGLDQFLLLSSGEFLFVSSSPLKHFHVMNHQQFLFLQEVFKCSWFCSSFVKLSKSLFVFSE